MNNTKLFQVIVLILFLMPESVFAAGKEGSSAGVGSGSGGGRHLNYFTEKYGDNVCLSLAFAIRNENIDFSRDQGYAPDVLEAAKRCSAPIVQSL